tara:strand:+ start:507 stop:770 length:264 start_codon:yes stop_codon:yes gene_type:complete
MYWIKNTAGKPDAMLTFAFLAFSVVTLNILLATFGRVSYKEFELGLQPMDAAAMTAYLAATFTAYVTRRWTDKKYDLEEKAEEEEDE